MWNCSWGNPYGYGEWFMGHGLFGWLISFLIMFTIIYIIFRIIMAFFPNKSSQHTNSNSLEILKVKFASGEITEDEYHRMKDILTR